VVDWRLTNGGNAYQLRNAIMNPIVENHNVRPYGSNGLSIGIERAFLFTGFTAGAVQRWLIGITAEKTARKDKDER
jgi:hypothetical protein